MTYSHNALLHAVWINNPDFLRKVVKEGVNLNHKFRYDKTALHFATVFNYLECVRILLENGADINAKDDGGFTPIEIAAMYCRANAFEIFIEFKEKIKAFTWRQWGHYIFPDSKAAKRIAALIEENQKLFFLESTNEGPVQFLH